MMHVGVSIEGVREGRVFDAKNSKNTSEIPKFDWLCLLKEQQFRVFLQQDKHKNLHSTVHLNSIQ